MIYGNAATSRGESFTADNDDAEVDSWVERGYVEATAKGGRDVVRKNKRKAVEDHYVAQQRGLDPQGIDGRGPAPAEIDPRKR